MNDSPEHVNIFAKKWQVTNEKQHLVPGIETTNGSHMVLPPVEGDSPGIIEGVDQERRHQDKSYDWPGDVGSTRCKIQLSSI